MAKILIIDDQPGITHLIGRIAKKLGHTTLAAETLAKGIELLRRTDYDCVFLDVVLPDGNGLDRIAEIKALPSSPEIIILTGYGDPDGAELAIKNGAWSYIEKSASIDHISLVLEQVIKYRKRRDQTSTFVLKREHIVGDSPAMMEVLTQVAQAASSKANVLLLGETGTGKEVLARTIHENGACPKAPYVVVDCAALPKNLVGSELFGHTKGAYTGADSPREGLVKQANGGTLFLDEIGELPMETQKAFLRVLQERRFRPIGSKAEEESNFRLIAATNRDLGKMSSEGAFRQDLFFRLNTLSITIPPLRERREDVPQIAAHHLGRLCKSYGLPEKSIAPDVLEICSLYNWPGNIRELVNTLERMLIGAYSAPILQVEHLPIDLRAAVARKAIRGNSEKEPILCDTLPSFKDYRKSVLDNADKSYLKKLLELAGGSRKEACRIAKISRTRLYDLMKAHNMIASPRTSSDRG